MAKKAAAPVVTTTDSTGQSVTLNPTQELVQALVQAIQLTRPVEKKNAANRKPNTPWTPKDGSAKLKLKKKWYQHSIPIDPDLLTNDQIALFNKCKVGRFMDNWVLIEKRRDGGMNITYPVKTPSQRMKLASQYGIAGPQALNILLQRCIDEAAKPKQILSSDEEDE